MRSKCTTFLVALWATGVAYGAGFTATLGGLGQDYAAAVTADARGNTYVAGLTYSKDFPVTPGAVQTTFGGTSDSFVAKLGPDGKVIWATFLGGILDDAATGIALDSAGNVIVCGWTRSADFPTVHAAQSVLNGGLSQTDFDAFVAKIDPTGSKLLYSTFLGGPENDFGYGLAVDAAGNAYVAGTTSEATSPGIFVYKADPQGAQAYAFFHKFGSAAGIAVDAVGSAYVTGVAPGSPQRALVFKLAPDGSREIYETTLGGGAGASGTSIAVGRDGSAYVGGYTQSADFPLVNPLQSDLGARPLWTSRDGAATWAPFDHLPFTLPEMLVPAPDALYLSTIDAGVLKSADGGATWTPVNQGIAATGAGALAADPRNPGTLYTGNLSQPGKLYKTVDAGGHWSVVDTSNFAYPTQVVVDSQNSNVYAVWNGNGRKSSDGGATWSDMNLPNAGLQSLALDPNAPGTVWAISTPFFGGPHGPNTPEFLWHSADAGATWTQVQTPAPPIGQTLMVDASVKPSVIYDTSAARSDDGGVTWKALPTSPVYGGNASTIAVDASGTLYAGAVAGGIYASHDRGATWAPIGSPAPFVSAIVTTAGAFYALVPYRQSAGFVTRLSPDGSTVLFSTLLGGHVSFEKFLQFLAEPVGMVLQNGVSHIALDRAGNVVAAGITRAGDFPLAGGSTCYAAGGADAFVATLAADGSRLLGVQCLGGTQDDGALAVAADPRGGIVFAGQTWSWDLAVTPGLPPFVGFGDAFVARIGPSSIRQARRR